MKRRLAAALLAALLCAGPARAQEVAAALGSSASQYKAAFDSFQKTLGRRVPFWRLPGPRPGSAARARVFVTFGGEAATQDYGEGTTVIACMAPGLAGRLRRAGPTALIAMKPDPKSLVDRLLSIQPKLKRLAMLCNSQDSDAWAAEVRRSGLEVIVSKPSSAEGVPEALRGFAGKADAVWLCPDPTLVTPQAFQTIKQFSWDHSVPFYAPTSGLAAAGAAAAVSVVPAESGRRAAELARKALAGEDLPGLIYASVTDLTVNPESAAKAGLVLSPEALNKADKVIR